MLTAEVPPDNPDRPASDSMLASPTVSCRLEENSFAPSSTGSFQGLEEFGAALAVVEYETRASTGGRGSVLADHGASRLPEDGPSGEDVVFVELVDQKGVDLALRQ
jgi:hypothetical protein